MIKITPRAAQEATRHLAGELPKRGLRIKVVSGGCSGYAYQLAIDEPRQDDIVFESENIKIIVDPQSAQLVDGATIDYKMGLAAQGFFIDNPNALRTCGCGKSFGL